ncbi:hypothetical protein KIN20_029308 [Parelaphostrongylus tenuis]|uniref:Uncharacterized protein n=1 Tax=Parelaphostrongylus tenuis TaxID=148309 RepID=A0AAD5WFG4_PARTN|nr:hypothetical protein KIN20_029308 [Parelaphostrongylus tenuis]
MGVDVELSANNTEEAQLFPSHPADVDLWLVYENSTGQLQDNELQSAAMTDLWLG